MKSTTTNQYNDDHENIDFKLKTYWDGRFTQEDEYDWLVKFDELKEYLLPKLTCNPANPSHQFQDSQPFTSIPLALAVSTDTSTVTVPVVSIPTKEKNYIKILVIGCGNSTFSSDLYDSGYTNIVNIDFSEVCINNMIKKHGIKRPFMKWLVMDMTDMAAFENESFDVVIDKATMDALMVDEGDAFIYLFMYFSDTSQLHNHSLYVSLLYSYFVCTLYCIYVY